MERDHTNQPVSPEEENDVRDSQPSRPRWLHLAPDSEIPPFDETEPPRPPEPERPRPPRHSEPSRHSEPERRSEAPRPAKPKSHEEPKPAPRPKKRKKPQNAALSDNIDIVVNGPEERRRRQMHKVTEFNVLTLLTIMMLLTLFMLFGKRPTTSTEENRDLAKCPKFSISTYLDGSFTSDFAKFFNDTVPMRSTFKSFISQFRAHLGIEYDGIQMVGHFPVGDVDEPVKETEPPTEAPTAPPATEELSDVTETETMEPTTEAPTEPEEEEEDVNGEIANNILVIKDRGIMLFGGSYSAGENYAGILNDFKAALGNEVKVYSLIAPTPVSFYLPKKYENTSSSEKEHIDHVNENLIGVLPVDGISALEPHKKEHIYSRTDHHWQPLGAYYAAETFARIAGVPFASLDEYEMVNKEGYVGTLYGYTNVQALKDNPEDFTYYIPQNEYTTTYYNNNMTNEREGSLFLNLDNVAPSSWYLVFMGGDDRITHIETDCHNGRNLFIVKDSYGNALVPCLTNSFENIWVIDMRYFTPNAITFMKERGATDVLFCMNTFSALGSNGQKVRTIMNQ